ncbi:hypothetical protein BBK36DRAFT_1142510 [Trichoderma citrinoviride]|uniref:Uncharacterized protein n=1 Tax=Trichoderma citrinoviride TaxID=58853 RepID=A0A2T4B5F3_9HYPO|nr:hypothetical protein BBK36DRAFT_1142510 [Trichoderma citrinoviride]PTB64562.1 hypothetical protein BBK36DRAFT_1142510 [Trichoderma citrinoviride]
MGGRGQHPGALALCWPTTSLPRPPAPPRIWAMFELQSSSSVVAPCATSGSKVNLASESFGHGPVCCRILVISFSSDPALQPEIKYRPTLWVRQTGRPTTLMNRCNPDAARDTHPGLASRLLPIQCSLSDDQLQGLRQEQKGCSSANELFLESARAMIAEYSVPAQPRPKPVRAE